MCASTATAIGHMQRLCSVHRTSPVSASLSDLKSKSHARSPTSPHGMAYCCMQLARFSLMRAAERIAAAKRQRADPDADQGAEERASEEGVRAVRHPPRDPFVQQQQPPPHALMTAKAAAACWCMLPRKPPASCTNCSQRLGHSVCDARWQE
jgi:hypothetical protein